jgi:uncharacterized protein
MSSTNAPIGTGVGVAETHISWVFFTPDRAFKLLKPVTMPFLDHSDPTTRIAAADREFDLNRAFAPDVYLGLADVREAGELVDRMIVMRRLPAERKLSALVDDDRFLTCLRAVGRAVAVFHARQEPVVPAPMATGQAVRSYWDENFAAIEPHVGTVVDRAEDERVRSLVDAYLTGCDSLFDARIRDGFVRAGHGDLIADDIFCLDDGPRIVDCLAFNDNWRIGDVLWDIAFLVMDVHRLAGEPAAAALLGWYEEYSSLHHPPSLAHHYIAYRAHVRTKIACLRYAQGHAASADAARELHRLTLHHLERARLRLVIVGGGPGVGKSTLANDLADRLDGAVLATDEIRKDLTATPYDEHRFAEPGRGIYDVTTVDAVYGEQLREARLLLDAGRSVILDASWARAAHREAARSVARERRVEFVEIECELPPDIAKERVAGRLGDPWNPSDATPEIVDSLNAAREPWPTSIKVSTEGSTEQVLADTLARIEWQPLEVE